MAQVIKNAVRRAVAESSSDFAEQVEIIKKSIKFCSDEEVLELANLLLPESQRLHVLFEKNREGILTAKERLELTKALEK